LIAVTQSDIKQLDSHHVQYDMMPYDKIHHVSKNTSKIIFVTSGQRRVAQPQCMMCCQTNITLKFPQTLIIFGTKMANSHVNALPC